MRRGIALVVSAPSGAGKSTLCGMLLKEFPNVHYSISCTTRYMREGEEDGKDYYFLDKKEFERRLDRGEFAEWANVHGNFYGTPIEPVLERLSAGEDVLLDVDVQGAAQIRKNLPEAVFVFILPPSMAELERRLRKRALDDEESIARRLGNARMEIQESLWYDALILNDKLDAAYGKLRTFFMAASLSPKCNLFLVESLLG